MPQNIFKIYDGRTSFWQWDRRQKLIVLDDSITEVHFSNRNMTHSLTRDVHTTQDGTRICNVPDDLLKLPRNLVAYAYSDGATVKSVKFAVIKRPMPNDYVSEQNEDVAEKFAQIDTMLETLNETKADDICYDSDSNSIQLTANGKPIGSRVELPEDMPRCIVSCEINEDGHLIIVLVDGTVIDAGYVGSTDGVTFIPHISEDKILTWTNDGGLENPEPVDLNPFDEWIDLGDDGEVESQYVWDFI